MRARDRVVLASAFVLHGRDWRETSRILDCFSREHGRFSVVARGARRPNTPWRALLQPFQPLQLSWTARGELGTLTGAEATGPAHRFPTDADPTLAAFYLSELVLRVLAPHDPHPEVFDAYAATLSALSAGADEAIVLRRFELELLAGLGYGLRLDREGTSGAALVPDAWYRLDPELGPLLIGVAEHDEHACQGADLIALGDGVPDSAAARGALRRALRGALDGLLGGRPLRTRAVARELRRGTPTMGEA